MVHVQSSGSRTTFLDRLEADSRKRERTRKEIDRKYYSQEAIFNDPMLAKRKARKDYAFLTSYFRVRPARLCCGRAAHSLPRRTFAPPGGSSTEPALAALLLCRRSWACLSR